MAEEDGQELVTKPFKFVTGKQIIPRLEISSGRPIETNDTRSRYELPSEQIPGIQHRTIEVGRHCGIASLTLDLGTDARFPNVNQTKHCWQNYVDYHKCIIAKGEDFAPCRQVRKLANNMDQNYRLPQSSSGSPTARYAPPVGTSAGTSNEVRRVTDVAKDTTDIRYRGWNFPREAGCLDVMAVNGPWGVCWKGSAVLLWDS